MGHALGLKHGHDAQDVRDANGNIRLHQLLLLPAAHDGIGILRDDLPLLSGRAVDARCFPTKAPSTLMQDDIYALQWMYGANYDHNSGNSTYRWNSTSGEMSVNGVGMGVPSTITRSS